MNNEHIIHFDKGIIEREKIDNDAKCYLHVIIDIYKMSLDRFLSIVVPGKIGFLTASRIGGIY